MHITKIATRSIGMPSCSRAGDGRAIKACFMFVLSAWTALSASVVSRSDGKSPDRYVPPLLANGDISTTLDYTCGMQDRSYHGIRPEFYRAGRRLALPSVRLAGFGRLKPVLEVDGEDCVFPDSWKQELDVRNARVLIDGVHAGAVRVSSEAFVCEGMPVFCVRRTVSNICDRALSVKSGMGLEAPSDERMDGKWLAAEGVGRDFSWRFFGQRTVTGVTRLMFEGISQDPVWMEEGRIGAFSESFVLKPAEWRTQFSFVLFADDFEEDKSPVAEKIISRSKDVARNRFGGLYDVHREAWRRYYSESGISIPDGRMKRMYDVAQYHLKCNATRWSFPVGIFPHHWQGKYFGFDEMYMHQGLVSSGHYGLARRCPDFRFSTMRTAKMRCGHYTPDGGAYGARWCWESVEDGLNECAPRGFWLDHIFHQGTIARTAWTQYLFTGDEKYLQTTGYPILKECARFFQANWVYEDSDGSAYIGKCTDLERLGPSRDRPFMTTCGAVYALRAAADAADVLKVDADEAAKFRKTASKLLAGLPVKDGRYVAYRDCAEESVAVLAGLYPFPVFEGTNALQSSAAWHFIKHGRKGGNMYPFGKGTCPWYAAKMSIAMTMLGDRKEPYRWLNEASLEQGLFGETFEINEPGYCRTPWFATGSGCVVEAVNTMLLANRDGELHIGASVPLEWRNYGFRLPAYGGLFVDCEVRDGVVSRLFVESRAGCRRTVRLVMPDGTRKSIEVRQGRFGAEN